MKQKKLIIFMPSIGGGGVEKNLFIISNYLAHKIRKVYLISVSKKYKKKFSKKIDLIFPNLNIWDKLNRKIKYAVCLFLLLNKVIFDKNVVVLCFQANIYCTILCKIFNIKIIVRSNASPSGWSNNFLKKFIFRVILNKADKVLVNSFQFKRQLKKEFNLISECIYNPLDIKEIKIKSKSIKSKIFKKNKVLKIINVGRLTEQKDQITLLKSLKLIKDEILFEAVIIGNGILKENLINFIKKNNLKKNIKFLNFVTNPFPLIKQADIFVLSSKYEGLPNVLLESLTLNKFIISSNCPTGPKEILLNGKGGLLFKVGDSKQLAKKIKYYVDNKKKCNLMLKNAINQLHRFDHNLNLKKYLFAVNQFI